MQYDKIANVVPELQARRSRRRRPIPFFGSLVSIPDDVWKARYLNKTYYSELDKMFQNPDGGEEALVVEGLRYFMKKSWSKLFWFSRYFVMCLKDFLVEKMNASDCQDPELVAAVINLEFAFLNGSMCDVRHCVDEELKQKPLTPRCVHQLIKFSKLSMERVLGCRNLPLLKLLIRYGVIPPLNTTESFNSAVFDMLVNFLTGITKSYRRVWTVISYPPPIEETFIVARMWRKFFLKPKRCYGRRYARYVRRQTVAVVVATLGICDLEEEAVGAKCVKYYFEATPEPFVVVREMEELILKHNELPKGTDVSLFKSKFERFASLLPDCNVLEPRSLKHLSRCAARSYLCRQGMLPDVISKLTLPNLLKDYLLIKNLVNESD